MNECPAFTVEPLEWDDEIIGSIALPAAEMVLSQSFGSGLSRRASDPPGRIWAVGDRGPNLKIGTMVERYGSIHLEPLRSIAGAKVMPRPDIGPRLAELQVEGGRIALVRALPVADSRGCPVSGLPMPDSIHAESEPAFDLDGAPIAADPAGLDSEGLVALDDGGFILSEEFGPSLVRLDSSGRVVGRWVPEGLNLDGAAYPVHPTLPSLAGRRKLNRGFEAIAISADQKWLFLAFQSPLAHPDEATHEKARHVRLWRLDFATMAVDAQFLYALDPPESFRRDRASGPLAWSDLKLSELLWLPGGDLLVLERGSETTKIYRATIDEESALPREHLDRATRPSIETMSAAGEPLPSLRKTLLFTSDGAPEVSADLEGMVLLSPRTLLLVNDNDFGVEGARTRFWTVNFAEPIHG